MYNIIEYKDKNGRSEVEEYILNLEQRKDKNSKIKLNKTIAYINMLSKYGTHIGKKYIKHIDDDIWELRPLKDRILFAYWKNNTFVLLSIFTKKTPKLEIEKAKKLLRDFLKRSQEIWMIINLM